MIKDAVVVRLRPRDGAVLEARLRAPTTSQRDVLRARIVLLAALEPDDVRCLGGEVGVRALADLRPASSMRMRRRKCLKLVPNRAILAWNLLEIM